MAEIDPGLYASYMQMQQKQQDSLRFQLDSQEELENFKLHLLGYVWDEESGKYKRDNNKKQQINEKGANMIMTYVIPRLSKLSSLSNMSDEGINKRAELFEENLMWFLLRYMEEMEIDSLQTVTMITDTLGDLNFATMMRSIEGWEGDGLRKQHTMVESKETINDNRQKGVQMPFKFPFGRDKQ